MVKWKPGFVHVNNLTIARQPGVSLASLAYGSESALIVTQ